MKNNYQSGMEKFNRVKPASNVLFHIIFILFSCVAVLPILLVISISLSDEEAIRTYGYSLIPKVFSIKSYKFLFDQRVMILRAMAVSLFVTIAGTAIGVLLTTSMGYVLSRKQFKLRGFLSWVVFIPMIFNGGMISTYFVNSNLLGLKNSLWVLVLPLAVSSFNVIIARTFFQTTIPDSLVESAKIDGATQLKIFFKIVIPISLPVIATIALFLCFAYWNDWFQSMLYIESPEKRSLQALLTEIMNNVDYLAKNAATLGVSYAELSRSMPKEGARMAIAVVIVVPIACAYPFFQKYFISGLTVGAVKG